MFETYSRRDIYISTQSVLFLCLFLYLNESECNINDIYEKFIIIWKRGSTMYFVYGEDNVKIAVYDLNPEGNKTIIMIHGWPLSEKIFEYQKDMLIHAGYRVITMDLRGFGNSDVPAYGYGYNQFASDVYSIVTCLGLTSFTLVGFSMGGAIALRYMGLFKGFGVNKLCLLGAAAPCYTRRIDFPYGVSREMVDDFISDISTDRADFCAHFSQLLFYQPHSEAILDWFQDISLSASGLGTKYAAYSLRDEDCRADISMVNVPTGIFHGEEDRVVPYKLGEIQHEWIKGSKMYSFKYSGHGIFYDELELFNKYFLDFLEDRD